MLNTVGWIGFWLLGLAWQTVEACGSSVGRLPYTHSVVHIIQLGILSEAGLNHSMVKDGYGGFVGQLQYWQVCYHKIMPRGGCQEDFTAKTSEEAIAAEGVGLLTKGTVAQDF